jgi:hypothetical protein
MTNVRLWNLLPCLTQIRGTRRQLSLIKVGSAAVHPLRLLSHEAQSLAMAPGRTGS